jgi:hypothetical protein
MINPAPPTARLPICTKCQSLANPFTALYWHMGEMAILFFKVTLLRQSGESNFDISKYWSTKYYEGYLNAKIIIVLR